MMLARVKNRRRHFPVPRCLRGSNLLIFSLVSLFFVSLSPAQRFKPANKADLLAKRIASILRKEGAREAHWGIEVISVGRGERIFGWNQDKLFVPASTVKLFTTAAALVRLGPDFTYRTTIETNGSIDENGRVQGDLILVGRGDPNLSARTLPYEGSTKRTGHPAKVFEELADQVWAHGVRAVDGDLIVDDTYFVYQPYGQGWTVGDLVWGYGAPVSALAINDNVITFTLLPGGHPGALALVQQEPMENYYKVMNQVLTVARGGGPSGEVRSSGQRRISVDRVPNSRDLLLWGQIPEDDPGWKESLPMDDPPRFAGEFLRQELAGRRVEIKGNLRVRRQKPSEVPDFSGAPQLPIPATATVLASHQSAPLVQSLKVINKVSQNLHAEMLLRTLGRERRHVGSVEAGLEEVNQFLREVGVPERQVALLDGSGLSRQSLVSPSATVALLRYMYNSPYRSLWIDSLPVAGLDGSLAERLRDTSVAGRLHAKTGSFAGVASLAGYITGRKNEILVFAIYMNHHNLTNATATGLIDRIAEEIAKDR